MADSLKICRIYPQPPSGFGRYAIWERALSRGQEFGNAWLGYPLSGSDPRRLISLVRCVDNGTFF
jgi:hypothetical protein